MFKKLDLIMVTEDYVSFETAKLLKEKGFDEPSRFWYDNNGVISQKYIDATDKPLGKDAHYHCVTISFAMKWLREVHNTDIDIDAHCGMLGIRCYVAYVSTYKPYKLTDTDKELGITEDEVKHRQIQLKRNTRIPLKCELIPAHEYFDTYEEACEAAIKYCLENLI